MHLIKQRNKQKRISYPCRKGTGLHHYSQNNLPAVLQIREQTNSWGLIDSVSFKISNSLCSCLFHRWKTISFCYLFHKTYVTSIERLTLPGNESFPHVSELMEADSAGQTLAHHSEGSPYTQVRGCVPQVNTSGIKCALAEKNKVSTV